jgi:hypothetical protein
MCGNSRILLSNAMAAAVKKIYTELFEDGGIFEKNSENFSPKMGKLKN